MAYTCGGRLAHDFIRTVVTPTFTGVLQLNVTKHISPNATGVRLESEPSLHFAHVADLVVRARIDLLSVAYSTPDVLLDPSIVTGMLPTNPNCGSTGSTEQQTLSPC